MRYCFQLSLILVVFFTVTDRCSAQSSLVFGPAWIPHPVENPSRSQSVLGWRSGVGAWGESVAAQSLQLQGFTVFEVKSPGNQGFDRVAIKRNFSGELSDARLIEVKTHRSSKYRLNRTRNSGTQMSRKWISDRLRAMRNSREPEVRKLANEIHQFSKKMGFSLTQLGEIHDINTRTGLITRISSKNRRVLSSEPIQRHLTRIHHRADSPLARRGAIRSLSRWGQIRTNSMKTWVEHSGKRDRRSMLRKLRDTRAIKLSVRNC